jgi:Leucine carboxyl methyltransferase
VTSSFAELALKKGTHGLADSKNVLRLLPPLRSTASLHAGRLNDFHQHGDISDAEDRDRLRDNRGSFTDLEVTAVLCALHRARETERRRPRLHDPYARRLVEAAESAAGCTSSNALSSSARINHRRWHAGIVVRTNVFDQIITRLMMDRSAQLVLNLAAGYDTRPYRLDLPASVQWIEADTSYLLTEAG